MMSDEREEFRELDSFDQALAELKAKMREIEQEKEKKRKEIEGRIPVDLQVIEYDYMYKRLYFVTSPKRDDVERAIRTIADVVYSADLRVQKWSIHIEHVAKLKEVLEALPNVKSTIKKHVQEIIDEWYSAWDYIVDLDLHHLKVKHNLHEYQAYGLNGIPGNSYNDKTREYSFPRKEAWRVYIILARSQKEGKVIQYTGGTLEFILQQVKDREELNVIAKAEDYPPYSSMDLNGKHLYPFQAVGVRFIELGGARGMIWDEMGLGKTPQAIALSKVLAAKDYPNDPKGFKTIIVCPAHLTTNWWRKLKEFRGLDTRIVVFRGLTPSKVDISRIIEKEFDYAIVSYNLLGKRHKMEKDADESSNVKELTHQNLWARTLNLAEFDLAVYDEAHYMGNIRSGRAEGGRLLDSKYVLLLTGTPLVNRPPELFPLLNIVDDEAFWSPTEFSKSYTYDGKHPRNTDELHELLRTFVIRRTKKDVLKDLAPIRRIPQWIQLEGRHLQIYNKALLFIDEKIDSLGQKWETQIPNILAQISKLRKLTGLYKMDKTSELATEIYDGNEEESHRKIICFSYWKETTYGIHLRLGEGRHSISFVDRASGGNYNTIAVEKRYERCDQFTQDSNIYFLAAPLMSTQEGLDITAAGSCIFNDMWWNPKAHEQAEGRAYGRLIDPHSLDSHYILCEETIDEAIWDLVWGDKAGLIAEVVDGVEQNRERSITKALISHIKEQAQRIRDNKHD